MTVFAGLVFAEVIHLRSLGWTLIHCDWLPMRRGVWDTDMHRGKTMKIQGKDECLQAERGLKRSNPADT